jgi:hypothetical protein
VSAKVFRTTLRLSKTDLDLLALAGRGDFPSVCKRAARAFVLGETIETPAPAAPKEGPTSVRLAFGEKDKETARFLSGVKKGFRSAALKLMIRSALGRPNLGPYKEGGDARAAGEDPEPRPKVAARESDIPATKDNKVPEPEKKAQKPPSAEKEETPATERPREKKDNPLDLL